MPPSVVKARPESIYYLFEAGAKANRERVDWPERVNRRDYPQTDPDRPWTSMLAVSVNGRVVDRIKLPDDAADAQRRPSASGRRRARQSRRAGRRHVHAQRPGPRRTGGR